MKTYYEKRSVEKDGLPKEDGRYITFQESIFVGMRTFEDGEFITTDLVTHYLVPVSERAVEERAIAFAEWITDNAWRRYPENHLWWKPNAPGDASRSVATATTPQLFALFQQQQSN